MRHTLSILVENRYGELARIVGLFSARGYNIESLTVAETLDPEVSCVTLVTSGDDRTIVQIEKQVNKLVRVLQVTDLTGTTHVEREMVLINVRASDNEAFQTIVSLVSQNRVRVAEVIDTGFIVEATGRWEEMNDLVHQLKPLGIRDIVRTGAVALPSRTAPKVIDATRVGESAD